MKHHTMKYEGNISDDLRSFLCTTLKQVTMDNVPAAKRVTRLVSFALELLDNAQRYSTNGTVEFDWQAQGTTLTITVTNKSTQYNAKRLKQAIDHVRTLNHEQIAIEYKNKMLNNEFNEKGGAGLGILQMAKQGATDIQLEITNLGDDDVMCSSTVIAEMINVIKTN